MFVGVILGHWFPEVFAFLAGWKLGQVNLLVTLLIWLMIYPMMVRVDFSSMAQASKNWKGLGLTLVTNWLIKPFSMALLAWLFLDVLFDPFIAAYKQEQYIAGAILLGAAPCTAMVFVWSYLTKGDANYTLIQVSVNDLVLLFAFVPIVQLLLGVTNISIPNETLLTSVVAFVVIPLGFGWLTHRWVVRNKGKEWLTGVFLERLKPVSIFALLATLILLFAFQGNTIVHQPQEIVFIAVPLIIQTYFIWALAWFAGRYLKLPFQICAPAAMIGASNFFELAVAVAIALFGLDSGATLATVVGVLIEVPIMLSLVALSNKLRYPSNT